MEVETPMLLRSAAHLVRPFRVTHHNALMWICIYGCNRTLFKKRATAGEMN